MGPGVRIPQSRPLFYKDAPVAELADALDLGSSVPDVKVQVLSGAPNYNLDFDKKLGLFYFCSQISFNKKAILFIVQIEMLV